MVREREITVRRTWIPDLMYTVIGEVWDYITDDSELAFEDFKPRIDNSSRWYVSFEDGELVGAFWMRRINHVTWEAHANVRPAYWGSKRGTEHCRKALDAMMEDTGAKKVVALIPTCCKPVMTMAEEIGFVREGVSVRSWQKNGVLYDQVHYGITRT